MQSPRFGRALKGIVHKLGEPRVLVMSKFCLKEGKGTRSEKTGNVGKVPKGVTQTRFFSFLFAKGCFPHAKMMLKC